MSQWLRPPRSLLLILALLTAASVSALAWFDWKLLDQERLVEAQRARERLEQTADRIAANLRRSLAEAGARLADAGVERGVEAVRLTLTDGGIAAEPAGR